MTTEEAKLERRRRGFWLRLARTRANLNQDEVARRLGMSENSGTTVLAWEQGRRDPKATTLRRLAEIYGVPALLLITPPLTDEERLDEIVRLAGDAERAGWATGEDPGREGDDGPADALGRRTA